MSQLEDYHIAGHSLENVRNINEVQVVNAMKEKREEFPGFCGCPICLEDVYAAALNTLPAKYKQHSYVMNPSDTLPADQIADAVKAAFQRVIEHPRHA